MAKLFINPSHSLSKFEKLAFWRKKKFLEALSASATWDPASTADNATSTATTVTVTGAKTTDEVFAKFSNALPDGAYLIASVTAPDTVSVAVRNETGSTLDLASGTLSVRVEDRTKYQR